MYEPFASIETILLPGAATSGFTAPSYRVGPRELYVATVSSSRLTVPCVLSEPTVIASGELPGDVMPPRIIVPSAATPSFPAAATTTMPACTASATASQSGSVAAGSIRAEHAHVDELHAGRHAAGEEAGHRLRRRAVAADDPGHVRAVTERIGHRRVARDQADVRHDLVR